MIQRRESADGTRFEVWGRAGERPARRKVYLGTFASRRDAEAADEDHRVTQRKIARGELPAQVDMRRTFGDAVCVWLAHLADSGSRSHERYTSTMAEHALPTFERVPLVNIRRADILGWRDRLGQAVSTLTKRQLSGGSVNTALGILSSAFSFFVGRDWIESNPCRGVRKLRHAAPVFPWLQSTEVITRLLSECTPNILTLVAFLVGTGCRLDEALVMRWDDVDLDHRLIHVHRGRKGTTKSGRARHVPIFDSVLPVLREMKLARGKNVLLWPGRTSTTPLSQPSVRAPFKRAVEAAELPRTLRLHDMRHTFASHYILDGGDIFRLSRILGHSSVAITERHYAHLRRDAFEADYGRVAFRMPGPARVLELVR